MKNKNYYPLDRNHYFYGKLLTVRDFEIEQRYLNNKRRLQNKLLQGSGVVAGLDLVLVDDQSVSLESGMALDDYGREIVVPEPVLKKLKLIDGFEEVKNSEQVYLCMEYDEKYSEPVHSVVSTPTDGDSSQFNRITESYRLYLTDDPLPAENRTRYRLEKDKKTVFENQFLTIEQEVARYVEKNQTLQIVVTISKRNTLEPVEVSYIIESEHLKNEQGQKATEVFFQEKDNQKEWKIELPISLSADGIKQTTDTIKLPLERMSIKIGDEFYPVDKIISYKVQVIDEPVSERILKQYYRQDFNDLLMGYSTTSIYLARLNLIISGDMYIIDSLEKMPYQQFVINNELLKMMLETSGDNKLLSTHSNSSVDSLNNTNVDQQQLQLELDKVKEKLAQQQQCFTTGTEEVDMGFERTKNKRFFSHEIAHGLGNGAVAIVLAVEDIKQYEAATEESVLIFGDSNVFYDTRHNTNMPQYNLGAIAYPEKGTFRIGLHVVEQGKMAGIVVRWWAYKHPLAGASEEGYWALQNIKITIRPDTTSITPREKVHFTANIDGTMNKEVRWLIKEEDGGAIDHNGVYEAPNREGVFEIIAQSVKYPQKQASAFVVVKS